MKKILLLVLLLTPLLTTSTILGKQNTNYINTEKYIFPNDIYGFKYITPIKLYNSNNYITSNIPVKIELKQNWIGWNYIKPDGRDIRFTDSNNHELSYWMEYWNYTSKDTIIWVKVNQIPENSEVKIYLHYGNPNVVSKSNGDNVFEFFDSFDRKDNSKWTYPTKFNYGFDNTNKMGLGNSIWFSGSANGYLGMRTQRTLNKNIIIEGLWLKECRCSDHFIYISKNSSETWNWRSTKGVIRFTWNCNDKYIYGQTTSTKIGRNYYGLYYVKIIIKNGKVIFYDEMYNNPSNNTILTLNDDIGDNFYIFIRADNDHDNDCSNHQNTYMFWFHVRKYIDNDITSTPINTIVKISGLVITI